jgi:atypical dual specificity phosphatase
MISDPEQYAIAMNFGWIEKGKVAGCRGPRTKRDLQFLVSQGIRALVRLTYKESDITKQDVEANMMEDCYVPVKDFTAPSPNQIDRVIKFIRSALDRGKPVAVSCGAGYGRTGTILACYLVSLGFTAEQAIERLIVIRPVSCEILRVPGQKEAIIDFERRLRQEAV